jgi:hypothetical protein
MAMWVKCRQCRPAFFSNLSESSSAAGQRRQKSSTGAVVFGQPVWMFHRPFHFVRDDQELNTRLFRSNSSAAPAAVKWKP